VVGWFPWAVGRGASEWAVWDGAYKGITGRDVGTASEPSNRTSKTLVTELVFVARGAFPRSTPCVCALQGLLPGRVFPDRTTRPHGLARLPPN